MARKVTGYILSFLLLVLLLTYEAPDRSSWTTWSLPLAGTVIAIDPGHGGKDGGAVSSDGSVIEKEVTLAISLYLRDFLLQSGAHVIMTREEDKDLASPEAERLRKRKSEDIRNRVKFVNDNSPDFLVSVHVTRFHRQSGRGPRRFTILLSKRARKFPTSFRMRSSGYWRIRTGCRAKRTTYF